MIGIGDRSLPIVIDASVAAKWVVLEVGSDTAADILRSGAPLHAPEQCLAEIANVLWKRARRGDITAMEAAEAMRHAADLPVDLHAHATLVAPALLIAMEANITVYDALYVALARSLDAELITADKRLVASGALIDDWPVRLL